MHHYRGLLIFCCLGIGFVTSAVAFRREYFRPYTDDPAGTKMKRLRRLMYLVWLISWIGIAISEWAL
jgi:hypothetical protein